jgi:hypothetical protein
VDAVDGATDREAAGDEPAADDPGPPAPWRRLVAAVELRVFAVCTFVLEPLWAVGPAALPLLLIPGTFALICALLVGDAGLRLVSSRVRRVRSPRSVRSS